jgi:tRNA 2-thiouridine synthesizing protein B
MALLHTVNKSPFERNALDSCLRHARKGSAILFIEDGVYALLRGAEYAAMIEQAGARCSLYALGPDLDARGIRPERLIDGVSLVDYHGFVDLAVAHDRVQSWL